jgi:hypothetical protein
MAEVHREHHQPGESAPVRQQVEKDHVAERREENRTRQTGADGKNAGNSEQTAGEDEKMQETVYGAKAKTTGGAQ